MIELDEVVEEATDALVIAVLGIIVLDRTMLLVTERAVVDANNEEAEELIKP